MCKNLFVTKPRMFNRKMENNPQQSAVVQHIIAGSSKPAPYLVFGPPGTGKTITLVEAMHQVFYQSFINVNLTKKNNCSFGRGAWTWNLTFFFLPVATPKGKQVQPDGSHPRLRTLKQCMWPSRWEADSAHGSTSALSHVCQQPRPQKHSQEPAGEFKTPILHAGYFGYMMRCEFLCSAKEPAFLHHGGLSRDHKPQTITVIGHGVFAWTTEKLQSKNPGFSPWFNAFCSLYLVI